MPHDVFISYSSHDKTVADAVCAALEGQRIRCWIAPRDVLPGVEYGEAIVDAISDCNVSVLVLSSHANESPQVRREVERAVAKAKIIIPFRIENVAPSGAMEYALSNTHWLDALTPPLERHLKALCETVSKLTRRETATLDAQAASSPPVAAPEMLAVKIHLESSHLVLPCDVPTDELVEMVIDELVEQLALPNSRAGRSALGYHLVNERLGQRLIHSKTLPANGISSGDVLTLVSESENPNARMVFRVAETGKELIGVNVEIVSTGAKYTVDLPLDARVESITRDLATALQIPTIKVGERVVEWYLQSRFLGGRLDPRRTLREQHIPEGDTLNFCRWEIAG